MYIFDCKKMLSKRIAATAHTCLLGLFRCGKNRSSDGSCGPELPDSPAPGAGVVCAGGAGGSVSPVLGVCSTPGGRGDAVCSPTQILGLCLESSPRLASEAVPLLQSVRMHLRPL